MSAEGFITFLLAFTQIVSPAKAFTNSFYGIKRGAASIERIEKILHAEVQILDAPNAKSITTFEKDILELEESLSRYAYSLTSNRDDAKDLVQETFFKALNNQEKFSDQTNIKAWIYTIMKNTFINDYRRRTKRQTLFSSDVQEYVQ